MTDPWVKMDEAKSIAAQIGAAFTTIHDAGHINDDSGYGKWDLIEDLVMRRK